jgi:hypothetical protein
MATKRRNVRYPLWMEQAVEKFAEKNKISDISKALIFLLECELNRRGYFRSDYEPNIIDYTITDDLKNPNETASEMEKHLRFEVKKLENELKRILTTNIAGKTIAEILKNEDGTIGFAFSDERSRALERIKRLPKDIVLALMKVLDDIESEKAKHAESNRENDQEKGKAI